MSTVLPHESSRESESSLMEERAAESPPDRITLALVSHTNVGKTTLARTLLRRDVGEVLDQAHVTEVSTSYDLVATDDATLVLWDTPGFGDSVRLLRRLEGEKRPILWFLRQTWDRIADRPLWSSQQAMRTVRDDTEVVLYLVNAAEHPDEAGYVAPELDLLAWTGRPVLLLLNQTGDASPVVSAERRQLWKQATARWPTVKDVLDLDAFDRCWVEESVLFARIEAWLDPARQPTMRRLREAWDQRNLEAFGRALDALANYLAETVRDRETLGEKRPNRAEKRRGMEALGERLVARTEDMMAALLSIHGLEGTAASAIEKEAGHFTIEGEEKVDPERGALWGGLVSGALTGLAADVFSGGLTFGGGLMAGAILGALGGAGLARGYQLVRGDRLPAVRWTPPALDSLCQQAVLRYIAVAHFGRGRGAYDGRPTPDRWRTSASSIRSAQAEAWARAWKRSQEDGANRAEAARAVRPLLETTLRQLLRDAYPAAAELLR